MNLEKWAVFYGDNIRYNTWPNVVYKLGFEIDP